MADETVTIRYSPTREEKEIPRDAIAFFPGWDVLKSDGSVNPNPATPTAKKD